MIFDSVLDIFRGKAITIPPLDGAFRANNLLDEAPVHGELDSIDNLAVLDGRLVASSGKALYGFDEDGASPQMVREFEAPVSATAVSHDGVLAVALENGSLMADENAIALPAGIKCITALDFAPDGSLWLTNGSTRHAPSDWVVDLMEKNASGSVWKSDTGLGNWRKIAGGLAWPFGVLGGNTSAVVSESWRHRLLRVDVRTAKSTPAISHLPGYPARLSPAPGGGAWLAMFAPRNRLIEMVLRESHYRFDMMASVPREFWIAPALSSGHSFLEPLQCGGIRIMGIHKPWAPSRSWGMVVRLDMDLEPQHSLHSRANGARHGVCSAIEHDGDLFIASKGGNCLLRTGAETKDMGGRK